MNPGIAGATAVRVLTQLRRDPRTVALLLVVPCALLALLKYAFASRPLAFQGIGGPLLGLFPFITMFVVTSIAMLRERTTGTLERLMRGSDAQAPDRLISERLSGQGGGQRGG